jgi:5'-3' exonuclease
MKTRTLVVDASYLLQRSYHGAKDTYTPNFGHIGGLYQFLTTVRMLIKAHMINKVILAWDGEGGGIYRHRIDNAYKENRKTKEWHKKIEMTAAEIRREREKEQSVLKQRMRIQEYAEELFLRQIEMDDVEADDLIAAYCIQHNNKEELFVYSNDRDFAQLLDLNITIIFPNIDQPVTKNNYIMYFNHHYLNALTLKIICGDDSDNVAGVGGIKEKTLLEHFPELKFRYMTVKEICQKADEINKKRVLNKKKPLKALENIYNNIERLKTNYQIVNLRDPMLTVEAIQALRGLDTCLTEKDRGSKNLLPLINKDQFLMAYGSTYVNYIEPFYTVVSAEKELIAEERKNKRKNL